MNTHEHTESLRVQCPYCRAEVGKACTTYQSGLMRNMGPHPERVAEAKKASKK